MTTVKLIRMDREVVTKRPDGRAGTYIWVPGYLVVLPNGNHLYPPVGLAEAKEVARTYYEGELRFEVQS